MFHNLLIYTSNFCFGYIAVSCCFETFRAGWVAGVVGKSDFNENPVVSLDLDFDLGFVNICLELQPSHYSKTFLYFTLIFTFKFYFQFYQRTVLNHMDIYILTNSRTTPPLWNIFPISNFEGEKDQILPET